jgi:HAD superfamily hydrolase (TIGR01509 family)
MWEPFIEESRLRVESVPVMPGVPALLERLVAGGHKLALLTGKDRSRTDELLAALGLSGFFSAVVTSTDGLPTKPAPDAVWAILELLECDPRRACMVGDAPVDIEAATAAGIYAIGVSWGIGSAAALSQAGAIAVLTSPRRSRPVSRGTALADGGIRDVAGLGHLLAAAEMLKHRGPMTSVRRARLSHER